MHWKVELIICSFSRNFLWLIIMYRKKSCIDYRWWSILTFRKSAGSFWFWSTANGNIFQHWMELELSRDSIDKTTISSRSDWVSIALSVPSRVKSVGNHLPWSMSTHDWELTSAVNDSDEFLVSIFILFLLRHQNIQITFSTMLNYSFARLRLHINRDHHAACKTLC